MRRNILTLTVIGGIAVALASLTFAGGLALLLAIGASGSAFSPAGNEALLYAALVLAFGIVAPALGLLAAWHGWGGLKGKPSFPLRLPGWGWLLLALIVTLVTGQLLFMAGANAPAVVAHILVAVIAALLVLAIPLGAARRRGWTIGRRAGATSLAWGGLGGIGLAIVLEVILALVLLLAAVVALAALQPDFLNRLGAALRATPQGDPTAALTPFLSSPWVLLGGLLVGALLIPLIEELCKSLAVPLVRAAGRPLTRLDAFLLGAAAGAGFTLIEGITNGATALAQPTGWGMAMMARSGVAVIHVLASALAGLAWHTGLVERRWGRAAGLFAVAVALHGAWNGGALTVTWLQLQGATQAGGFQLMLGNLGAFVIVAGMGLAFFVSLIALAVLPGRLALGRSDS
jgi:RsiW-degrading membrane proteinase PrsW (M82 family)